MFCQVLKQGKLFAADFADELLLDLVDLHVAFEAVLGFEAFGALLDVALV